VANTQGCDAIDPYKRPGYVCCYTKGHSDKFPHRFVKEDDTMLTLTKHDSAREALRHALNSYERELRDELDNTPRGSGHAINEYDHLQASITQVQSAKRVLHMDG